MTQESSRDALKSLLMEDAPPQAPAHDLTFALDVMKRVERRRLIEGLVNLGSMMLAATAILFVVMPYMTPLFVTVGKAVLPAVAILTMLGMLALTWRQISPVLRDYGFSV